MMPVFTGAPASPRHGAYEIDGVKYPRVSAILGVIARPGLEAWRQKVGFEEANRMSNAAAEHGTALHKALEILDTHTRSVWRREQVDDFLPAIEAYRQWCREHVAAVLMVEQTVYHVRHTYAGTLDRLYLLRNGRRVIADFKTGTSVDGIYRLQQTAYQEALEEMGHGPVDSRLILHLPRARPGELRVIEFDDDERDRRCWRAVLRLYKWTQRHKDDWRQSR
jgi:hypothetical protein